MTWGRLQAVAISGAAGQGLLLTLLPLLAVSITTDPAAVSLVNVVGQLPWLLFSLFAGVLIDRARRTAVLGWSFAVLAVSALALAAIGERGGLPLLLAVAFVVTSAQVLGDGASGALVPEVVGPDRLASANARLMVIEQGVVRFVVPPLAGFAVGVGTGYAAWGALVCALLALAMMRGTASAPAAPSGQNPVRDIAEGLKYLVGTRLLLAISVAVALGSFASSAEFGIFVLYAMQEVGVDEFGYGVLLACTSAGWVAMSFFVDAIVRRLGYSWSMRLAQLAMVLSAVALALAPRSPAFVGVVMFLNTALVLIWNVCSQSSRQRFTPSRLLGRVLTGHRALAWGLNPLGALAGGLLAAQAGLRSVYWMAAVVQVGALAVAWFALSPKAFREAEDAAAARAVAV
ncbi:MFS transporter [Actinosynnema pretiosum]|uniref:MFS transporter n=1 Tax=Actinosynnema pretiosum TaxID=42197 RepID=A0A290ZBK0_9PSEU|nr:MFS transporter [Actinosynnema pretiosum]ATE56410.1 MFS transporter [Actinosynnema pretiosum]